MYEFLKGLIQLIGVFIFIALGGWCFEYGRMKARRALKVCDICFKAVKAFDEAKKQEGKE